MVPSRLLEKYFVQRVGLKLVLLRLFTFLCRSFCPLKRALCWSGDHRRRQDLLCRRQFGVVPFVPFLKLVFDFRLAPRTLLAYDSGLSAGMAIGIVGDAGVRAVGQQERLFVGMILILIFAEALGLYGMIVALILSQSSYSCS